MTFNLDRARIGIVGLGYVGLPLAVEFGKQFDPFGFGFLSTSDGCALVFISLVNATEF